MAESRREREKVLAEYRRQAEEKKEFKEKVERRVSLILLSHCGSKISLTAQKDINPPLSRPE